MTPLLLALAAIASQGPPEIQDQILKLEDGTELRYALSTPQAEKDETPRPLVLALHFGWSGDLPPHYGKLYMNLLVAPALADLDAIIIAPDAPERSWTNPRSEQALLALIDHTCSTHSVDADRIVITGFSLGAMGTWYMASRHPDLFSAAIPISGPPVLSTVPDAQGGLVESKRFLEGDDIHWPPGLLEMPIFAIHSRADELVPFDLVSHAIESLRAAGGRAELVKIKSLGHFETPRFAEYLERAVPWLRKVWRGPRASVKDM